MRLGSMIWSHTYLGGVEAIRWFIFSVAAVAGHEYAVARPPAATGLGHPLGAVVASLWTALQFWIRISNTFRRGPTRRRPSSTGTSSLSLRCARLPFSVPAAGAGTAVGQIAFLAFTTGFNIVAILMTGTRSALDRVHGFLLDPARDPVPVPQAVGLLPVGAAAIGSWLFGVLFATVLGLGLIQTGNAKLLEEHRRLEQRGKCAGAWLLRGPSRSRQTEEYTERSFSVRLVMWKATMRIIKEAPADRRRGRGVGSGHSAVPERRLAAGDRLLRPQRVPAAAGRIRPGRLAVPAAAVWLPAPGVLAHLRNKTPEGQAEAPLAGHHPLGPC
jgi:O-antigen ligase